MEAVLAMVLLSMAVVMTAAIFLFARSHRQRRSALKRRFGREYESAVEEYGDRRTAEERLAARERRMANVELRLLSPREYERYSDVWATIQKGFVDDPVQAVGFADGLVAQTDC